jgi:hypothetical protein
MAQQQKQLETWPLALSARAAKPLHEAGARSLRRDRFCIHLRAFFSFSFQLYFTKLFDCISKLQLQDARKNCRANFYRKAATFFNPTDLR